METLEICPVCCGIGISTVYTDLTSTYSTVFSATGKCWRCGGQGVVVRGKLVKEDTPEIVEKSECS